MSAQPSYSKQDPDYEALKDGPSLSLRRQDELSKRNKTLLQIKQIIGNQFDYELQSKEDEIMNIDGKISQAKVVLDKLRAYLLANYYGNHSKLIKGDKNNLKQKIRRDSQGAMNPSFKDVSKKFTKASEELNSEYYNASFFEADDLQKCAMDLKTRETSKEYVFDDMSGARNRFYAGKKVIVGNISKFIPLDKREKNDQSTHKWMVYVRSPPDEPNINSFVKRVWFFLHPSYMPNDIIEITSPPFTITRRGWGEFPVRIQLIFSDPRNKPVDIIHNLKLDKTYTGLQTLGAETTVELEIQRHTVISKDFNNSTHNRFAPAEKHISSYCENSTENTISYTRYEDISNNSNVEKRFDDIKNGQVQLHTKVPNVDYQPESLEDPHQTKFSKFDKSSSSAHSMLSIDNNSHAATIPNSSLEDISFDQSTNFSLMKIFSSFPLICEERDVAKQPYCAKSLAQYKRWSHSKRRAAEWQRALDVKRALSINNTAEEISTKHLMIWCRQHGHTPPEISSSVVNLDLLDFCPCCGKSFLVSHTSETNAASLIDNFCSKCLSNRSFCLVNSLSSFESFITDISLQEYKLGLLDPHSDDRFEDDNYIDIVSYEGAKEAVSSSLQISDGSSSSPLFSSTPEMDWIFEVAAQIEIHLPMVSFNNTQIPLLQHMLLIAIKLFIKEILTNSFFLAKQKITSNQPVVVNPIHIHQYLKDTSQFDFLTNLHMGIQEEDGDP